MKHHRRSFIKLSSAAAAWLGLSPVASSQGVRFSEIEEILAREETARVQGQASVINLK